MDSFDGNSKGVFRKDLIHEGIRVVSSTKVISHTTGVLLAHDFLIGIFSNEEEAMFHRWSPGLLLTPCLLPFISFFCW